MKYLCLIFSFYILSSCQPKDLPTVFQMSEGYAIMKVSHMTTQEELIEMAEKLSAMEIQMDHSRSEFFEDKRLKILNLYIVTPEGKKGATKADIVALQFRYFGFLYQKEGSPSFKIGEI